MNDISFFARAGALLVVAWASGCTTSETGFIDLPALASSLPSGPGSPLASNAPPTMPAPAAAPDSSVECTTDGDCTRDPARPRCDVAHARCVGCLADADCPAGEHCAKDRTCQK